MSSLEDIFNVYREEHEKEETTRNALYAISKNLDTQSRKALCLLQVIHTTSDRTVVAENISKAEDVIIELRESFKKIEETVLAAGYSSFARFHDIWRHAVQRLTFLVSLLTFLKSGKLVTFEETAKNLSMRQMSEEGLQLELDDYLHGLLTLASELSRLAVNSVTHGDEQRPLEISRFVGEMDAGFRLLSFKNDYLRKKYDALKYDLKKIEEVVYDLSVHRRAPAMQGPIGDH